MYLISSYVPQCPALPSIIIQSHIFFLTLQPHRCYSLKCLKNNNNSKKNKKTKENVCPIRASRDSIVYALSIWYCIPILISDPLTMVLFHTTWLDCSRFGH